MNDIKRMMISYSTTNKMQNTNRPKNPYKTLIIGRSGSEKKCIT